MTTDILAGNEEDRTISWRKAYGIAILLHAILFTVLALCIVQNKEAHEAQEMQVVNLTTGEVEFAGSGHAGSSEASSAFPAPLSQEEVAERRTEVQQTAEQAVLHPETPAIPHAVSTDAAETISDPEEMFPMPADAGNAASTGSEAGASDGEGSPAGMGSGDGAGTGGGTGSGDGTGEGDGRGYGEGSGAGTGSGDSGAAGSGSAPFDTAGFWAAVNANKNYPYMAIKRHLEGTVGLAVTLDAGGNCAGAELTSSSGSSILDQAALAAARAACPYPNPTGSPVTIQLQVNFVLQ